MKICRIILSPLLILMYFGVTIAFADVYPLRSNDPLQDRARSLPERNVDDLRELLLNDKRYVSVIIITDNRKYGGTGDFTQYVDQLAKNWQVPIHPKALMVVHELDSNLTEIRMGPGYSDDDAEIAKAITVQISQLSFFSQSRNKAIYRGMKALLDNLPDNLPAPYVLPLQVIENIPSASRPKNIGAQIQDGANVLNLVATNILTDLISTPNAPEIYIETAENFPYDSRQSSLGVYANETIREWGSSKGRDAILILYEGQSNRFMLAFGPAHSRAYAHRTRNTFTKVTAPALRQHLYNAAFIIGIKKLLEPQQTKRSQQSTHVTYATITSSLADPNQRVFDFAGFLLPSTIRQYEIWLQGAAKRGLPAKLIIMPDHSSANSGTSLQSWVGHSFITSGMEHDRNSILVVYDVASDTKVLRLGSGYSRSQRVAISAVLLENDRKLQLRTPRQHEQRIDLPGVFNKIGLSLAIKTNSAPPTRASLRQQYEAERSAPPAPRAQTPIIIVAITLGIGAVTLYGIIRNRRRLTKGKRERTARISAWKRGRGKS